MNGQHAHAKGEKDRGKRKPERVISLKALLGSVGLSIYIYERWRRERSASDKIHTNLPLLSSFPTLIFTDYCSYENCISVSAELFQVVLFVPEMSYTRRDTCTLKLLLQAVKAILFLSTGSCFSFQSCPSNSEETRYWGREIGSINT